MMSITRTTLFMGTLCLLLPATAPAANKEHEAIQRDISMLADQVRQLQSFLNNEFAGMKATMQQAINSSDKSHAATLVLETRMTERMQSLEKAVGANIANISTKVDTMADEFRAVKEELKDVNSRMGKMGMKMDDVLTAIKILQGNITQPPAATPPAPTAEAPGGSKPPADGTAANLPPAGVSSEKLFADAQRDMLAGRVDLALKGYNDFLKLFPKSELACQAQFHAGEMLFRKNDIINALIAFDAVIERYDASCPFRPNAQYMKGRTLVKGDQPTAAAGEFRKLKEDFKGTEWERRANESLKEIGFSPAKPVARPAAAAKKRTR